MSTIVPPTRPEQDDDEQFCGVCFAGTESSEHHEKCTVPIAGAEDALREAKRLLRLVLHLRANGERAPGGEEAWDKCDVQVETFLRSTDSRA